MQGSSDGVAHYAHLGGMLIGLIYLKLIPYIQNLIHSQKTQKNKIKVQKNEEEKNNKQEVISMVNKILDKINDEGIDSLSEHERRILKQAGDELSSSSGAPPKS